MKWWWEHSGHYVNSLYLSANKVTLINPSQHGTMHWSYFTRRRVPFEIKKCRSLWRPKWMNYWQENPIIYEHKRFMKFVLQWMFSCTGLKRFVYQNKRNFRFTWIEPDKRQPYGQMLIGKGQLSDWSAKFIRWHVRKASFLINHSNTMSDNCCRKWGLRQRVPEAYSPKNLLNWRLRANMRLTGR